ncbi:hypothetical protein AWE51_15775 [Aquimarina aggregata]|uniref:Uncharacterized protein n=1 Tax=Aquimarina aggregata TaxID=1642818 RepID=A0A163CWN2_9FLAO|nr:hypothetical protein [Aquimarina aggregata]KZS42826.1 hypothetical protein AWE51_15775 [Aquimarina aggregata]
MKKVEKSGVQSLSIEEQINVNGGTGVPPWLWQAAVATFLYNVVADWEENVAAFNSGSEAGAALFE